MSCVGVILWRVGVYSDVLTFGAHLLRQRKHWKCPPSVLLRSRCWQRNFAFTYLAPITFKYKRFIVYQVDNIYLTKNCTDVSYIKRMLASTCTVFCTLDLNTLEQVHTAAFQKLKVNLFRQQTFYLQTIV